MKKIVALHRVMLACTTLTALAMPAALSARPAAADLFSPVCSAKPSTPQMTDGTLYIADAPSETVCQNTMDLVQADAQLIQSVSGEWVRRASGSNQQKSTSWVWADALSSCKGEHDQTFYTSGYARGWGGAYFSEDGWRNSNYTTEFCGDTPDPKNPGGWVFGS